jgi:hypothetical protein
LNYANAGATSLFTTAGDLGRWMHNLATGTVGGAEVLAMMHERFVLTSGDTIPYALGLVHGTFRGLPTVGHGGADAGFRSSVMRFPEQHLSVTVLSNLANLNPGLLAQQVAEIYLEGEIAAAEPAPSPAPAREPDSVEGGRVGTEPDAAVDLTQYVGVYDSPELETTYTLVLRNDTLVAEHVRHDPITLAQVGTDRFLANVWFFGTANFTRDASGEVTGMRVSSGRVRNLLFVKRAGDVVGR